MTDDHGDDLPHQPVLYQEVLTALRPQSGRLYIDGTVGAGGHAFGILTESSPDGELIGMDVDPNALRIAEDRLAVFGPRVHLLRASYTEMKSQAQAQGWQKVSGILLDLGASSMQFDSSDRGFSFRVDSPLDMRFDPSSPVTAANLVNSLPEDELSALLWKYGEEHQSRQIARRIVAERPVRSTLQLAEIVLKAVGSRKPGHIHPATKTFQALRIAVNGELESIAEVLPQAMDLLESGGRLAVITFHSLEDRIVKTCFHQESSDCICPPEVPVCICNHHAIIREINHRPIVPSAAEILRNARARSAHLRVIEKR